MARSDCPVCSGTGWKVVGGSSSPGAGLPDDSSAGAGSSRALAGPDGQAAGASPAPRFAVPCECTAGDQQTRALDRARIPRRYEHCNFENFDLHIAYEELGFEKKDAAAWNRNLERAKVRVEAFAREYPLSADHGLLLIGPSGTGKTHLAIAALTSIVLRGHQGLFYDYNGLLKQIQASYNPENQTTEMEVLEPVLKAEVLLLDDLGASKPSAWALETVGHILNVRYNEKRTTLVTTNYLDTRRPTAASRPHRFGEPLPWAYEEILPERIGKRIRSRLYEMCRTIEVEAPDYRESVQRPSDLGG